MDREDQRRGEGADLAVVGAGLIGLSCALEAARSGLEVLVVDAGAGERASEVAAGMIAPVGEASWGEEALLAAALESAELWPDFAARLEAESGEPVGYRRCGALHVGLDRDEAAELRRFHDLHGELGLESEWLTAGACRRAEPGLATDVSGGFSVPGEAEVDPRVVLHALRVACERAGVRIRAGEVTSVPGEDRVAGLRLADGSAIEAARVLLAAGARIAALTPGGLAPVRPVKGEVVRLRARPGRSPAGGSSPASGSTSSRGPAARWSSGRPSRTGASTRASPRAASTSCYARRTGPCPRSPSWR